MSTRMWKPEGAVNQTYNGTIVSDEGIEVEDGDVDALLEAGWTLADPAQPEEPKEPEPTTTRHTRTPAPKTEEK